MDDAIIKCELKRKKSYVFISNRIMMINMEGNGGGGRCRSNPTARHLTVFVISILSFDDLAEMFRVDVCE